MSETLPGLTLPTRVGHADWGENRYRGFRTIGQLAGKVGLWSMVSLALGHRRLSDQETSVLDDLHTCGVAADPRIWPLKITRLVAAYGGTISAFCAGQLPLEKALIGPWLAGTAAQFLCSVMEKLGSEPSGFSGLRDEVVERLRAGSRFDGFGVPFRNQDERVLAFTRCLETHGRTRLSYWRLMTEMEKVLVVEKNIYVNIGGASAAALLDLGFTPRQISGISMVISSSPFIANAMEGVEQSPAMLRKLPQNCVNYIGQARRPSPRQKGK